MKTYRVTGVVTVSAYTDVRAVSVEHAIKIAQERAGNPRIGGPRSGYDPEEFFIVEDADGEVTELNASEL